MKWIGEDQRAGPKDDAQGANCNGYRRLWFFSLGDETFARDVVVYGGRGESKWEKREGCSGVIDKQRWKGRRGCDEKSKGEALGSLRRKKKGSLDLI